MLPCVYPPVVVQCRIQRTSATGYNYSNIIFTAIWVVNVNVCHSVTRCSTEAKPLVVVTWLSQLKSKSLHCSLDYPDPLGQDAHMGILDKWNSPDNWSTYFFPPVSRCVNIKRLLYTTTTTNTIHASTLGHHSSLKILLASSVNGSPHHQKLTDPTLCAHVLVPRLSLGVSG